MNDKPTHSVVVVCPTEYGGHIEHAADLSIAIARHRDVGQCLLVSRPGAKDYLGLLDFPELSIVELLPARRQPDAGLRGLIRPALQVFDLVVEHTRLRCFVRELGTSATVLLESPKYPFPQLAVGSDAETVLFMHNAKPHVNQEHVGARQRVLGWLERRCVDGVQRLVTHGKTQVATLAGYTDTPAVAVGLPTGSALGGSREMPGAAKEPAAPYALCIGELRPNKGVELAIEAAGQAGVPLLVAGKSESSELAEQLAALVESRPKVRLRDEFLAAGEFDTLIRGASLVVLPYTHFDAQSGILSKAIGAGVPVLAADLPALRDQAGKYASIAYTDVNDPEVFARDIDAAFACALEAEPAANSGEQDTTEAQWDAVAAAVLGGDTAVRNA